MKVVFQTRFSFFGQSGWKSAAAADPGLLFSPERLDARLHFFETITLPSLAAQSHGDFSHMVLSSELMPDLYKARLRDLLVDTLGEDRVQLMFLPRGSAGKLLRNAVNATYGKKLVAQVVLDDDDAVACDFVELLHSYGGEAWRNSHREQDYTFLSFPRGYTLGIGDDDKLAWLEHRFVPYTNLGLALIAPATTRRNPYMTSHKKIGLRHPSLMITNPRPYYLRAVHGHNDSRAYTQNKPFRADDVDKARKYFPFLSEHFREAGDFFKSAAE